MISSIWNVTPRIACQLAFHSYTFLPNSSNETLASIVPQPLLQLPISCCLEHTNGVNSWFHFSKVPAPTKQYIWEDYSLNGSLFQFFHLCLQALQKQKLSASWEKWREQVTCWFRRWRPAPLGKVPVRRSTAKGGIWKRICRCEDP